MDYSSDDLASIHAKFLDAASDSDLFVCETAPVRAHDLQWPRDDPNGLIDLAKRLQCRLVYIELARLEVDDLTDELETLAQGGDLEFVQTLNSNNGKPVALSASFMFDGLQHGWAAVADWYAEIEDRVEEASANVYEQERENAEAELLVQIPKMAQELAESARFRKSPSNSRGAVCRQLFADLRSMDTIDRIVDAAQDIVDAKYGPLVRADKANKVSKSNIGLKYGLNSPTVDKYLLEAD